MIEKKYNLEVAKEFLRQHFKKPPLSLLERMSGAAQNYSYVIQGVEEHLASKYCDNVTLLWIEVDGHYLDCCRLPSPHTWGLFALNNEQCLALNHQQPKNFSLILQQEQLLQRATPYEIAVLSCDALLSTKLKRYTALADLSDLSLLTQQVQGYVINDLCYQKLTREFVVPKLIKRQFGFELSFTALVGTTGKQRELVTIQLIMEKDGDIVVHDHSLGEELFLSVPMMRYRTAEQV